MKVPNSLRQWFIVHFVVDWLFALPLIIAPRWALDLAGWVSIDPVATRLVAAALIGIGSVSFLVRNESAAVFKALLTMKLLWSGAAVLLILVTAIEGGMPGAGYGILGIFTLFFFVWAYYRVLLSHKF